FISLSVAWTKMKMTTSRLYFTSMFGYNFMPFSIPMIKSVEQRWKFFRLDTEFGLVTWLIWNHKSFMDSLRQVNPRVVLIGHNSSIDGKQPSEPRRMTCGHCNAIIDNDATYCSKCGASLSNINNSEAGSANRRKHHAS
ncbi:MAG: zinc ribbon domain-containing protein, partial [Candidatus Thermoplasmatota archaeon]|nr:zinc ribbon domain-containing protein [Candidatus Thermoplasmatota archaeon]